MRGITAYTTLTLVTLSAAAAQKQPQAHQLVEAPIVLLSDLPKDTSRLHGRVRWGSFVTPSSRKRVKADSARFGLIVDTVTGSSPADLAKYFFGNLAPKNERGLFYNQTVFLPAIDPLKLDTAKGALALSPTQFSQLLHFIRGMETGSFHVPSLDALIARATQVYKLTGAVPIVVLDVEYDVLSPINGKDVGINSDGRLVPVRAPQYETKHLLAVGTVIPYVPARRFVVVTTQDLVISNRRSKGVYVLSTRDTSVVFDPGVRVAVSAEASYLPFSVQRRGESPRAVSYVSIVPAGIRLPHHRLAVLRPSKASARSVKRSSKQSSGGSSRQTRYMYAQAQSSFTGFMTPPDSVFVPGVTGGSPARLTSESSWEGMEVNVWFSDLNAPLTPAQRTIEPLFILGGLDEATNEPQALFNRLSIQLGAEAMALLRQRFDIFVLGYFAGGSFGDCASSTGDTPECRRLGIRRSVQDNAVLVADAMYFVYEHFSVQKKAVFIGISMGGVVSRLAFLGIEHGPDAGDPTAYRSFPSFSARRVPVRRWITIDSPHQGALIPLGLQDWIRKLSWLPPVATSYDLLDGPSSREQLIEHFRAGPRTITSERQALENKFNEWGRFPTTVDVSIAVASGSASLVNPARTYLWKRSDGHIPWYETALGAPGQFEGLGDPGPQCPVEYWYVPDEGTPACMMEGPITNVFNIHDTHASEVSQQSEQWMSAYLPLGPRSIPIQQVRATIHGSKSSGVELNFTLETLTAEPTYDLATFDEIKRLDADFNEIRDLRLTSSNLSSIWSHRWRQTASVSGIVSIEIPVIGEINLGFNLAASDHVALTTGLSPLAMQVGGFRETARQIRDGLHNLLGSQVTTDYLPRHAFVPTISAIDLKREFLEAAYTKKFAGSGSYLDNDYGRGKKRGHFDPEDYLDYYPFFEVLGGPWEWSWDLNRVFVTGREGSITLPDGSKWTGKPSPFTFVITQWNSLEHTYFDTETAQFLIALMFFDGDPLQLKELPPPPKFKASAFDFVPRVLPELPNTLPPLIIPPKPPVPPPVGWERELIRPGSGAFGGTGRPEFDEE